MKDEEEWRLLFRVSSHLDKSVCRMQKSNASEHRNQRCTVVAQFHKFKQSVLLKKQILHIMTCLADTFRLSMF